MSRIVTTTGTLTKNVSSYDTTHYAWYSSSDMANGYTASNSNTYATINLTRGANAETYVYWKFDFSTIPNNARITSVTCKAKGYISQTNANRISSRTLQVYSGTSTTKGSATTISTSTSERTLNVNQTWTVAEIKEARIQIYAKRGTNSTNSNYYLRFYGATMTVDYEYDDVYYTVTASSSAQGVTVYPASQELIAGSNAVIDISGVMGNVTAEDNGVDVTASIVQVGTNQHRYTIVSIAADHVFTLSGGIISVSPFRVKQNGSWHIARKVFVKDNGTWKEAVKVLCKHNGQWV